MSSSVFDEDKPPTVGLDVSRPVNRHWFPGPGAIHDTLQGKHVVKFITGLQGILCMPGGAHFGVKRFLWCTCCGQKGSLVQILRKVLSFNMGSSRMRNRPGFDRLSSSLFFPFTMASRRLSLFGVTEH